jgi:methylamine dehydrogenase accessory protein MauD
MLLVSNIILWIVVLVLLTVMLALLRQVGILYERIAPAGAHKAPSGLKAGEEMPLLEMQTLDGRPLRLGGGPGKGKSTLLFFLSPNCPVCKTLLPVLQSIRNSEAGWLDIVLASDGDKEEHRAWLKTQGMESWLYVLSPQLGMTMQVGQLPFAALVDEGGILRARNPVNNREQIESMLGDQYYEMAG